MMEGVFPYCAMMQIAAEDTNCNYVICRGYDPRNGRFYDYGGGAPGIAVAKPYWSRRVGVYRIGQVYPAVLSLSAGGEQSGKIVWNIGQNPGRVANDCQGNPLDLEEEITHIEGNGVHISWMLIDGGPSRVYFTLDAELEQFTGDIVDATEKIWDPTAESGDGGFTCGGTIQVGDLNYVGHTAAAGGEGSGIMHEREKDPYWVCVIDDLCCPGDEQSKC
jgi:hypothetical protein